MAWPSPERTGYAFLFCWIICYHIALGYFYEKLDIIIVVSMECTKAIALVRSVKIWALWTYFSVNSRQVMIRGCTMDLQLRG